MKAERIIPSDPKMIENGDFAYLRLLGKLKAVKVDQVITSPKSDKWLGRVAMFIILAFVVMVAVGILRGVIR